LIAENAKFGTNYDSLLTDLGECATENAALKATIKKLKQKNRTLRAQNDDLNDTVDTLNIELENQAEEIDDLQPASRLHVPDILSSYALGENLANVDPRCINPRDSGFTCIGLTKQKRRCGNSFLSNNNKADAADVLRQMRSTEPGNTLELPSLCELANALLCPRWHNHGTHDQTEPIARSWYRLLADARAAYAEQERYRQTPPVTPEMRRPTRYSTGSAKSSFSGSVSSTSSSGSYPSTAATTPERDDEDANQFDRTASPSPSVRRNAKASGAKGLRRGDRGVFGSAHGSCETNV
jgi:regulator of replication initiation timing